MKKLSNEEYILKAQKIHGDRYDYSETVYKSRREPVTIVCKEHGPFIINAGSHLSGYACKYCSGKELSNTVFIEKAQKVHGDKYIYIEDSFKGVNHPVDIICTKHGIFNQLGLSHLAGNGCPKCSKSYPLDTFKFIQRMKQKFGDRYDYSQVSYINKYTEVTIICPKHGPFKAIPNNLYYSDEACWICSGFRHNTETFVERAIEVQGNTYSYNKVKYENNSKPVCITCYKHGDFYQIPHVHLSGAGCPTCSETRGEKRVRRIIEALGVKYEKEVKFKDCKYKTQLRFDFFVKDKNVCIEYDGILHYKYIPGLHKNYKAFIDSSIRDRIKDKFCNTMGINLIRIPYYKKSDEIKEILSSALK